jgi:hypothetical protein
MNRKRKQRKSSVRRGARKELNQKEQKRLLLLGIEPCTPTATTVYIRYIYGKYGLYAVYIRPCVNPFIRIRIRIRSLQQIYGRIYTPYICTPYISVYGFGQPYLFYDSSLLSTTFKNTPTTLNCVCAAQVCCRRVLSFNCVCAAQVCCRRVLWVSAPPSRHTPSCTPSGTWKGDPAGESQWCVL